MTTCRPPGTVSSVRRAVAILAFTAGAALLVLAGLGFALLVIVNTI